MEGGLFRRVHGDTDGGAGAFAAAPPVGQFHDDAAFLERGAFFEQAEGLGRGHGQGLEKAARLQPLAHEPGAGGGGAHGFEQRGERGLVFLPGVKLEGARQREVLGLAGSVELFGEGGEEGEGALSVGLVFRQVEGDASDGVPGGVFEAQPVPDTARVGCDEGGDMPGQGLPPAQGGLGREVLRAWKGRRGGEEGGGLVHRRRRHCGGVARLAEAGEEAARPLAQPAPGGVEFGVEQSRRQQEQQSGLAFNSGGGELTPGAVLGRAFAVENAFGAEGGMRHGGFSCPGWPPPARSRGRKNFSAQKKGFTRKTPVRTLSDSRTSPVWQSPQNQN